jgi:hypothetical protein
MPPRETLAAAASSSNFEALAAYVVLAHPRAAFRSCMCALRGGAATVAATRIGYDHVEVAAETATRRRRS